MTTDFYIVAITEEGAVIKKVPDFGADICDDPQAATCELERRHDSISCKNPASMSTKEFTSKNGVTKYKRCVCTDI
jgi:hypothetical protein